MNNHKPIYLMAGGRGDRSTSLIMKAIFKDIVKPQPLIAYVGAASGDNRLFFKFVGNMIKKSGSCNLIQVMICNKKADINKAKDILLSADAVFMSGGDVEAGMKILEVKNLIGFFKDLYQQGKVFFGASAGSIMLASEWVRWSDPEDDATAALFPCLNLAPVICDTHAEEDDWVELQAALKLQEKDLTGYGISSGTCLKVYPDGRVEALGGAIIRYLRNGDRIAKQPDLLSE